MQLILVQYENFECGTRKSFHNSCGIVLYGSISKFKELQKFASTLATTNTVSLSKFAAYIYTDL